MAEFGLTPEGFAGKSLSETREEMNADAQAKFTPDIDVGDDGVAGRTIGIVADRITSVWELAEALNAAFDPDKAEDAAQDSLCALTGTVRQGPTPSTVELVLSGDNATEINSLSLAAIPNSDSVFETLVDVVLATVDAWLQSTAYVVGDLISTPSGVFECLVGGISDGAGTGPASTESGELVVDNTVTWVFIGPGLAAIRVDSQSTVEGPISAGQFGITQIDTPVSGWDGVLNIESAQQGTLLETNENLRVRREEELQGQGTSPLESIRIALSRIGTEEGDDRPTPSFVRVLQNVNDTTDVDGIPPHAIEAIVQGGNDQDIFDTLLGSVAAGIKTHGNTVGSAEDSEGIGYPQEFTRPDEIAIYAHATVIKVAAEYAGDEAVKEAVVAHGDPPIPGRDAVSSAIIGTIFKLVAGVLDVTELFLDTSPAPTLPATVNIELREVADYDVVRVTVTSLDGIP